MPAPDGIPTAELHVHLEGTLEPELIFAIAERNGLAPGASSVAELRSRYAFDDLQSFLDIYYDNLAVLRTAQDYDDMTSAYLERAVAAHVRRAEIFIDPQSHLENGIALEVVFAGIGAAVDRFADRISVGLIACFLRHLGPGAAEETLDALLPFRDRLLGVGLDSTEVGFPNRDYAAVFARAGDLGLRRVAHAGEEGGPDNVWDSLDLLGAERIDHGVRSLEDDALVARLVADRIPLTVCPNSNVRLRVVDRIEDHPLARMLEAGLVVTVNSDDPAYFGGYLDDNLRSVAAALALSDDQLEELARNSFDASFASADEVAGWKREVSAAFRPAD